MLSKKDLDDAQRIADIFRSLSEEDKNTVNAYLSALNDRRLRDERALLAESQAAG